MWCAVCLRPAMPEGRSVGHRAWGARRHRSPPRPLCPSCAVPEVLLTRGEQGGTIELRINAANDAVVEVMSSISAWAVTRVSRQGEAFVYRLTLPSGSHRIAVRINGGAWRAPLGLASVEDDFGTGAGLVVVP